MPSVSWPLHVQSSEVSEDDFHLDCQNVSQ